MSAAAQYRRDGFEFEPSLLGAVDIYDHLKIVSLLGKADGLPTLDLAGLLLVIYPRETP